MSLFVPGNTPCVSAGFWVCRQGLAHMCGKDEADAQATVGSQCPWRGGLHRLGEHASWLTAHLQHQFGSKVKKGDNPAPVEVAIGKHVGCHSEKDLSGGVRVHSCDHPAGERSGGVKWIHPDSRVGRQRDSRGTLPLRSGQPTRVPGRASKPCCDSWLPKGWGWGSWVPPTHSPGVRTSAVPHYCPVRPRCVSDTRSVSWWTHPGAPAPRAAQGSDPPFGPPGRG